MGKGNSWKLEAGSWKLEAGSWKLEAGSWKLEAGSWKLEAGSWKLEAGSWKLEAGSWKLNQDKPGSIPVKPDWRDINKKPIPATTRTASSFKLQASSPSGFRR
ncbi:hypothetical protein UMZ34_14990 [Halopseudomonas pachastrellae]|nr:hypothetical protein UMZ34_14990 [Halopseudomonas pachastrellae]